MNHTKGLCSHRTRIFKVLVSASLLALSSCSSCSSCQKNEANPEGNDTSATKTSPVLEESPATLAERARAIARVETFETVEQQIQLFLGEAEENDRPLRFSFEDPLRDYLGGEALADMRRAGNIDLAWFDSRDEKRDEEWIVVFPVESAEAFFKTRGAREDGEVLAWSALSRTVWAHPRKLELERGQTSDPGDRVLIASTPALAKHGEAFLKQQVNEQRRHLQVHFWPSRIGATPRWERFGQELSQRLAASGHGLIPGRASLVNLETLLYGALGDKKNWPEPLRFNANFKIREGKPKAIRTYLHVPVPEDHAFLVQAHDALTPRKGGTPPITKEQAIAELRLRLDRTQIEESFDTIFPERWRLMLASRGEDSMTALTGTAKDLLEFNRGPTLVALYEQRAPLSGETLLAWEGMDLARVDKPAQTFTRSFIESFWAPLHLADQGTIEEEDFSNEERGLTGKKTTFVARFGTREVRMGTCWAKDDERFAAYFGTEPCVKLLARLGPKTEQQPAAMALGVDLKDSIDLLYMPPGKRLMGTFVEDGKPPRLDINGYARDEGNKELEFEAQIKDPNIVRAMLRNSEELEGVWGPIKEVDLGDLLQRATMEQAIYQDPGVMLIGPPGGLGAAPPAYFLGMPFSLAPAPPTEIKKAVLGDEPTPKNDKTETTPK